MQGVCEGALRIDIRSSRTGRGFACFCHMVALVALLVAFYGGIARSFVDGAVEAAVPGMNLGVRERGRSSKLAAVYTHAWVVFHDIIARAREVRRRWEDYRGHALPNYIRWQSLGIERAAKIYGLRWEGEVIDSNGVVVSGSRRRLRPLYLHTPQSRRRRC